MKDSRLLYRALDLKPGATQAEIKAAFRRLALAYHPDRHGGSAAAAARFREIAEAYKVLYRDAPASAPAAFAPPPAYEEMAPAPAASPRTTVKTEAPVNVGLLGLFFGLAVAGVGAVLLSASAERARRQQQLKTALRPS